METSQTREFWLKCMCGCVCALTCSHVSSNLFSTTKGKNWFPPRPLPVTQDHSLDVIFAIWARTGGPVPQVSEPGVATRLHADAHHCSKNSVPASLHGFGTSVKRQLIQRRQEEAPTKEPTMENAASLPGKSPASVRVS